MTDMAELRKRKGLLDRAILEVNPGLFAANFLGWLEITAFISALKAGTIRIPDDGVTPKLSSDQLEGSGVERVAKDAVFAFFIAAALKGEKAAVDAVEAALTEILGPGFPASSSLQSFSMEIETPASLDDYVIQVGGKMLRGEMPPPPMRAKEYWNAGLRFFEKARGSNFVHEIMYPLARWHRERGAEILEKGVAFLAKIEESVPVLREALADPRNDQAFIANFLLKLTPAVDMELTEEYQGLLRSLSRRI
jgi:hypothetical protein